MWWRLISAFFLASVAQAAIADPDASGKTDVVVDTVKDPDRKVGSHLVLTWTTAKSADVEWRPILYCVNKCKGKIHSKHEECDLSCDDKCPDGPIPGQKPHKAWLESGWKDSKDGFNGSPDQSNASKLGDVFSKEGMPGAASPSQLVGGFLKGRVEFGNRGPKESDHVFTYDHFNKTPCSSRTLEMAYVNYNVTVDYDLSNTEKVDGVYKTGPSVKGRFYFILQYPDKTQVRVSEPTVSCQCERVQYRKGYLPIANDIDQFAFVLNNDMKRPVTAMDITSTVSNVVANDMNTASFTLMPPAVGELHIPAGWELQCVDGTGQNLQLQEDLDLRFGWNLFAGPGEIMPPKTVRVMCLEITKPEPRPDMKYVLVPPGNPLLARLSAITKAARVRGPWDQMRLWIATDAAPYEKIAKTLIPAPGPGTYVREMYRAASVGAISPYEPRFAAIMDPKLLLAKNYDPVAVRWFLAAKLRNEPSETLAWFARATTADWTQVLDRGTPKEDETLVGLLVAGLGADGGVEGVKAAVNLMGNLPEAHRSEIIESAAVKEMVLSVMVSADAETASTLLDWLVAAKPSYAVRAARAVDPRLPESVLAKGNSLLTKAP